MSYPLGQAALSTLRATAHWHCSLYRVSRRGGRGPLLISTLDRQMVFRGQTYMPTAGERYDAELAAALESGDTQILGCLSARGVTPVDIQLGVYDSAKVDEFQVDWRREKLYRHDVWYVDEIAHNGRVWSAKLSSLSRALKTAHGEIYNQGCGATLGDGRCKAIVATTSLTVTSVADSQLQFAFTVTGPTTFADGYFALGSVEWITGSNRTVLSRVLTSVQSGIITLSAPVRFAIRVGDTLKIRPGCDGLASTCKNKFSNLLNFQNNERQKNAKQLIVNRALG